MVLVEVEVSEEDDEGDDQHTSADNSVTDKPETIEETKENIIENVEDSNSAPINDLHNDSSLDQNDSRSIPFSSKNDSEIPSEHDSNQEGFESTNALENQDSLQTENSTADVPEEKTFDIAVLNNDSQTQCKPDEKDGDVDSRNGVSFISVRSVSSLFDSSDTHIKKESSVSHEPMETETIKTETKLAAEIKLEIEPTLENTSTPAIESIINSDSTPEIETTQEPEPKELNASEIKTEATPETEIVPELESTLDIKNEDVKMEIDESEPKEITEKDTTTGVKREKTVFIYLVIHICDNKIRVR